MPNHNPTRTNYLCNSVDFNSGVTLSLPEGANASIEFARIPIFPTVFDFTESFTIEAWVKPSGEALIRSRIVQTKEKESFPGLNRGFMLGLLGDETFYGTDHNALRVGISTRVEDKAGPGGGGEGQSEYKVTCDPVLKRDTWHHIIGHIIIDPPNSDTFEIYVDGCKRDLIDHPPIDYTLDTSNTVDPTEFVVGWDPDLEAPFKGAMASLAFFNRLLTSEEIETLAQGISNLLAPKSLLKSTLVAWWQMGDGDPADLSQLLDSVSTNHLTTINMDNNNLLTEVPKERPRKHQCTHAHTYGDELKLDPNSFGSSFLWESWSTISDPDTVPFGWFGAKEATDKFQRVNIPGRLSVLRLHKGSDANEIFITNIETASVGNTLTFGNPLARQPTDYCMECVVRHHDDGGSEGTGDGNHYFGWIEDPHGDSTAGFTKGADPLTGVYARIVSSTGALSLIMADGGTSLIAAVAGSLTNGIFYRIKICFKYYPSSTGVTTITAEIFVNGELKTAITRLSTDGEFPVGTGDVFIGSFNINSGTYNFDIAWINIHHRGIGHHIIDPMAAP